MKKQIFLTILTLILLTNSIPDVLSYYTTAPSPSQIDFLVSGWDRLPVKSQKVDVAWVNYVNSYFSPNHTWDSSPTNNISLKCLSYAASTVNDWFLINTGGVLGNYTDFVNGKNENGTNPRELETIYHKRINEDEYFYAPFVTDYITQERVPHGTKGYADTMTRPLFLKNAQDRELNIPSGNSYYNKFRYSTLLDEYAYGEYKRIAISASGNSNDVNNIINALKRTGIVYAQLQDTVWGIIGVHTVPIIGYDWNASIGKYDFWLQESVPDENGLIYRVENIDKMDHVYQIFFQNDWAMEGHDLRRTGHTLLKGDISSVSNKLVWSKAGDTSTDFWDAMAIANIDNDEGQEIVVVTSNESYGRVYVMDGKTSSTLWSFNLLNEDGSPIPLIADIDGDNKKEIIVSSFFRYGSDANRSTLWVLNSEDGTLQWNYSTGGYAYSYAAADVDNDGEQEVIFSSMGNAANSTGRVYVLNKYGNVEWASPTLEFGSQAAPAIGDLNKDGVPDVVITTFTNVYALSGNNGSLLWNNSVVEYMYGGPAMADLDNDGNYEIVVGTSNLQYYYCSPPTGPNWPVCGNRVYVLNHNGSTKWFQDLDFGVFGATPAIANLDNDSNLEVVVATRNASAWNPGIGNGTLYVFDGKTGNQQWNFTSGGKIGGSPAIADIDGDNVLDIIFGAHDGFMYIVNQSGSLKWKYNMSSYPIGSPAIGDLDGDGVAEIAIKHAHGIGSDNPNGVLQLNLTNESESNGSDDNFSVSSSSESTIDIIGGINNQPVLNNITNISVTEGNIIILNATGQIYGIDSDNDSLTYSFTAPFNSSGQWQTYCNDSGNHTTLVEVFDGNLTDYQYVNIEINNTCLHGDELQINSLSELYSYNGSHKVFEIDATNADPTFNTSNISLVLDTGDGVNITNSQNFSLQPGKGILIFVEKNYTDSCLCTVNSSLTHNNSQPAVTSENITANVGRLIVAYLSNQYATGRNVTFDLRIKNQLSVNTSNILWNMTMGDGRSVNATQVITLKPFEEIFVITEHNYTSTSSYIVNGTAKNGTLIDSENITISVT